MLGAAYMFLFSSFPTMGASGSAIPYSLYKEVMHDIAPAEMEDIDVS